MAFLTAVWTSYLSTKHEAFRMPVIAAHVTSVTTIFTAFE
jgi:hypothetical protein